MSELHLIYAPTASATNVLNVNSNIKSPGQNAATGTVPSANLNDPDNVNGSGTVVIANESQNIVLGTTPENNVTQNTVHGRYDKFTVLNNPG